MKIKYNGKSNVRIVEGYRWDKDNGFIVDVIEAELAAELITAPDSEFLMVTGESMGEIEGYFASETHISDVGDGDLKPPRLKSFIEGESEATGLMKKLRRARRAKSE
jgi:hypothetical protein